jgi:AraC-like DNA-binding protein
MTSRPRVRPHGLVQVAHYPPGSTYGPRPLRDFEFVWVLSGSARWRVTDSADGAARGVELRPGTLALARPGTTDSYEWDAAHASSHAYIHFDVDHDVEARPHGWPLTRPLADHDPLHGLCRYLLDLASVGEQPERRRSDQVVEMLLDLFLTGPFPRAGAEPPVPAGLMPALDHVWTVWETAGVRAVRVAELAEAAATSPGHLSRAFTRAFGCGPATTLELVRLGRAAIALQRSNLSIAHVARHHGFADAYHFSKRFKRVYRIPPGQFRHRGESHDPLEPIDARGLHAVWAILGAARDQKQRSPAGSS